MSVIGYDVYPPSTNVQKELDFEAVELDKLLKQSDFIVLCCNLTEDNVHLLSKAQFETMKEGARIINVARGPLIDEKALAQAVESGRIAGAALDVFEVEPLPSESPLRGYEQCIFGTHNSSHTTEAVTRVNELAIGNLLDGLGIEK